jgi:hypothetical protein
MAKIAATTIDDLTGFIVSADANHIVLLAQVAERTAPLAIPVSLIPRSMAFLSAGASRAATARGERLSQHTFEVEDISHRPDADADAIILDLKVPGDLRLSFKVSASSLCDLISNVRRNSANEHSPSAYNGDYFHFNTA